MEKKFLVKVISNKENVGKIINILTLCNITGFYVKYCKGIKELKEEDYSKAYQVIKEEGEDIAIVGTVVSKKTAEKIEKSLKEKLKNEDWKLLIVPVLKVKVHRV
ncbi:MJ1244 family protein [Methanocaldococcus infernus]